MLAPLPRAPRLAARAQAAARHAHAPQHSRLPTLAPRAASCALGCKLLLRQLRCAADAALSRVLLYSSGRSSTAASASAGAHASAAAAAGAQSDGDGMWLVVGLGNPGKQYASTRHNVGFMAIDALAAAEGIPLSTTQLRALVGKGVVAGKLVLLVKPQTFMNCSGESVVPLLKFYKVPPSRLLVLYDDLDIDVAALRLRGKGGHGGHNGMRSIITCLSGSQDFARLRIGIGRPACQRAVSDHVLTTFDKQESQEIQVAVAETCDVVRAVLSAGVDRAMSKYNTSGAAAGTSAAAGTTKSNKRARTSTQAPGAGTQAPDSSPASGAARES